MNEGIGLRFSRGGRSGLGLFVTCPVVEIKDIRSDASIALYVEASESVEAPLEWVTESNEKIPSSGVRKVADGWTMGDLNPGRCVSFGRSIGQRMAVPGSQLLLTRCGIHTGSTCKLRVCLDPLLHGFYPRFHEFLVLQITLWVHHRHRRVLEGVLIGFEDAQTLELRYICWENGDLVLGQGKNLQKTSGYETALLGTNRPSSLKENQVVRGGT